jgi:hypothetical protein
LTACFSYINLWLCFVKKDEKKEIILDKGRHFSLCNRTTYIDKDVSPEDDRLMVEKR